MLIKIKELFDRRNFSGALLLVVLCLLFSLYAQFANIGQGTPSLQKHGQIFKTLDELKAMAPEIVKQREQYYVGMDNVLDPTQSFDKSYQDLFGRQVKTKPWEAIPHEKVLERTRGFLIGAFNSDEQNTMRALSKINPWKGKFNPGVNAFYGGFYYYACGAALLLGKVTGVITLDPSIEYYLYHPEQTRSMYMIIRLLGALSVFCAAAALFFWMWKQRGAKPAVLGLLFFVTMPSLVPYSHMAKSHNLGMFLFFMGFIILYQAYEKPGWIKTILGAIVLGLSAATIVTNLTLGITIFLLEWSRQNWQFRLVFKNAKFWAACCIFFLVYIVFNLHILLNFESFQRSIMALNAYMSGYGESYGQLRVDQWLPFLADMFSRQLHWSLLPFLLIGLVHSLRKKEPLPYIVAALFLFLFTFNILLTRHPGVNIRTFPLIAFLCAEGVMALAQTRGKLTQTVLAIYLVCGISLSAAESLFYNSLYRTPDNLQLAGDWVNENIPEKSTIGVVSGQFTQTGFPAFRFFNYELVHFPWIFDSIDVHGAHLPQYVLTGHPQNHPVLESDYNLVRQWQRPNRFCGIPFNGEGVSTANMTFSIYKKKEGA